jgi:deoxyribodipyrimidine photo-lyase
MHTTGELPHYKTYQDLVDFITTIDPVSYAKTRNHLDGDVTRLSPYITRGVISLPDIRSLIYQNYSPEASEKLIQELAWREYFYRVWYEKGDAIFDDLRFEQKNVRSHELVSSLVQATTGITVLDDGIRKLYNQGYMHNHVRMWVAMTACTVAKAYWYPMSRWMYYHLLDGDIASNTLSWQWVAGTSRSEPYTAHQQLINACSSSQQTGTFLDVPRDDVGTGDVPDVLEATESFAYTTELPQGDDIILDSDATVFLYHPWHLDPTWRNDETADVKVLVLEPSHFNKFPVSQKVIDFIITTARTMIPGIQLYVGEIADLKGIDTVRKIYTRHHPCAEHFPCVIDERPELFPDVPKKYYKSFFAYWKEVGKRY